MVGLSRPQLSIIYGQSRPIVSRWIDQYESDRTSVEEAPPTTALLGHTSVFGSTDAFSERNQVIGYGSLRESVHIVAGHIES